MFFSALILFLSTSLVQAEIQNEFSQTGFIVAEDLVVRETRSGSRYLLPTGLEIALLEQRLDPELGLLMHIGIDVAENAALPSDLWVPAADLPVESLVPYAPGAGSDSEWLAKMTYCYRYVKQYLLQIGKVNTYLPGASAYQAATILPRYGFRNTGRNPQTAREGEVCVYAGGPQGHGHIEVKRNGKWWYGYGYIDHPIRNRRFLGCFDK